MKTDRYPDSVYKKNQTGNLSKNTFSGALKLVHNPKFQPSIHTDKHALIGKAIKAATQCVRGSPLLIVLALPQ